MCAQACAREHTYAPAGTHMHATWEITERHGEGQGRNKGIQLQGMPGTAHGHPKLESPSCGIQAGLGVC